MKTSLKLAKGESSQNSLASGTRGQTGTVPASEKRGVIELRGPGDAQVARGLIRKKKRQRCSFVARRREGRRLVGNALPSSVEIF